MKHLSSEPLAPAEILGAPPDSDAQSMPAGERFGFGDNWRRFIEGLDDESIAEAQTALRGMLEVEDLNGLSFLDVGSGSGLFSLAAYRLGARVHSFDLDLQSVACTRELRHRYAPDADSRSWSIEAGSALDEAYIRGLGEFDVVYSWGVLHHTGDMQRGLELVTMPVASGGRLFISIYNDQGRRSRAWRVVKRIYNQLPGTLRIPYVVALMGPREVAGALIRVLRGQPMEVVRRWTHYNRRARGMSRWHDMVDWVGGYPFEVARPDFVFDFFKQRGFLLQRLVVRESGCNEYVFTSRER